MKVSRTHVINFLWYSGTASSVRRTRRRSRVWRYGDCHPFWSAILSLLPTKHSSGLFCITVMYGCDYGCIRCLLKPQLSETSYVKKSECYNLVLTHVLHLSSMNIEFRGSHLVWCSSLPPLQIIHLKRFQFFNGRWVKSQRIVRFPTSNLDPLRFTAQNGNQKRAENGTETTISGTESREDQERPENGIETAASSKEDSRIENPLLSDTRPNIANTCTVTTQPLANGGRGHPAISEDPQPVAPVMEAMSQQDQLDKSLYNREGNVYNLVAITVSLISVTMLLNSTMYIMSLPPSLSRCAVSHGCTGRRSLHVVLQESQRKLVLLQRQLLQGH